MIFGASCDSTVALIEKIVRTEAVDTVPLVVVLEAARDGDWLATAVSEVHPVPLFARCASILVAGAAVGD